MESLFGKGKRTELSKEVGARLRQRRLALGLDQTQVMGRVAANASKKGVPIKSPARATLSQYEIGAHPPGLDMIIALAEVLETTREWIAFGIGEDESEAPSSAIEATPAPAQPNYWEAEVSACENAETLSLIAVDQGGDPDRDHSLLLYDRAAQPAHEPARFVAAQAASVIVVQAVKAGDVVLIEQSSDLWRAHRNDDLRLLGKFIGRLASRDSMVQA
jgi:transcriptional regulator with XRE-family HTH domain